MLEKLKSFLTNDQSFYGVTVILVGVVSFSLGRMTVMETSSYANKTQLFQLISEELTLEPTSIPSLEQSKMTDIGSVQSTQLIIVASKAGTKYHLTTCPGAKQIKEENKITFTSREAAEAAGYKPAANCPELQ